VNKPRTRTRPLTDFTNGVLAASFRKQGFASSELVVRWRIIVGEEVAACAEPLKIQWSRVPDGRQPEPGTLVLRVEGPAALEIQHMAHVIRERVNRYFGWAAIAKIALRQAPLRRPAAKPVRTLDPQAVQRLAETMPEAPEELRMALSRLGVAVKRK